MATNTISIPAFGLSAPKSWGSRDSIKEQLKDIWAKYKDSILFAEANSNIPKEILTSFIAVESGGNPLAGGKSSLTQGLMQWNRTFANTQLEREKAQGRLSAQEEAKLKSYGITFDKNGKTRVITNADQIKPDLNILIGSIILGQLVDTDWGTENGEIKMDRVIAVYNAGAYGDTGKKARSKAYKTPSALAGVVNPVTKSYIAKMMGKDGAIDIIKTDNILV